LPAQTTAAEFAQKAYAALPVEEPFAFHKVISEWREPLRRDPAARPSASEIQIAPQGWSVLTPADSGQVLQTASEEFREYLERSMQVRITAERTPALSDWSTRRNVIVAGTREQLPGCGRALRAPKDYRLLVRPDQIVVCGYDERGVMYCLFDLERRM